MDPIIALVFPGQGSQKAGMLAELAVASPTIERTFAEASGILGFDLWQLCQKGSTEDINLTENTQLLLLVGSVAVWRVWQERGGPWPDVVAGHSLGEWSALVCAGVVTFEDAVSLVRYRGRFMQEAVPVGVGAMAAVIGLDDADVESCCVEAAGMSDGIVSPVNYNSPGQVVIAGASTAVECAGDLCKAVGARRILPLPVSAPFHTEMMRPAAERLADKIDSVVFSTPVIPVIHNIHGQSEAEPEAIKALMIEQIYSPVLWVDCVKSLVDRGVEATVECGTGKVLSGLIRRIHKPLSVFATEDLSSLNSALDGVKAQRAVNA